MSRKYLVIGAVWAAACNPVESAAPVDAPVEIDAAPDAKRGPDAAEPTPGSILAVHRVFDFQPAGDELRAELTTASSRLLVLASASAQRAGAGGLSVAILIDGQIVASLESATNEADSPKALVSNVFEHEMDPGAHTVSLLAQGGTTLGASDLVDVTILELGADARVRSLLDNRQGVPPGAALFSADLPAGGGTGILFVAGSGYGAAAGTLGMSILLDDVEVGQSLAFSNEALSHKAFVPAQLVLRPDAGTHRFALKPLAVGNQPTVINQDDRVDALWLELGSDAVATQVMDRARSLPATGTITTGGGPLLVISSASAFRRPDTTPGVGVQVTIGDTVVARNLVQTREVLSHKTMVSTAALVEVPAGEGQAVRVAPLEGQATSADANDYYSVTAIELRR
jgi:hypothetical protein